MNNTTDRITLFESTDGEILITATEEKIFIVTPFNASFKDELKARFRARWNSDTKEWIIAFRHRDDLDPLLYDYFGVSMIAEVTTPSLMKVSIDMTDLYLAGSLDRSTLSLAGRRLVKRWARDRKVEIAAGVECFEEDGITPFEWPASGGSKSLPALIQAGTKYQPLGHGRLVMGITPAELDWLRENEVNFELLDGGQSAEPEPEDPQLDPEDLSDLHEDDEIFMDEDEDEDHIYVQEEEAAEVESEVDNMSDEYEEDKKMKKNMKDTEDFMTIDPITMDDRKEMEMKEEERANEDRIAETKAANLGQPTNEKVVEALEAFDKRLEDVDDPDTDVEIERGSRQVFGIGCAGDIIRGIELRKEDPMPAEELEAWMKVSDFVGDVFPRFMNPREDHALLIVDEWNGLMDSIVDDEDETTPEIRQAAADQKIIAIGRQNGPVIGMDVYDDGADVNKILGLRKPNGSALVGWSYTTQAGVHAAVYSGWDGDDAIIWAGGYVDGSYVGSDDVERAGLFEKLSEDVRAELEPLACGDPAEWNGKILEMEDNLGPDDTELLAALWIGEEVVDGEVTVYGVDDDVMNMDEYDFEIALGLHRVEPDEDDEDEDEDE